MFFLLRWLFAFILLAATYNPTQFNFIRWVDMALKGEASAPIVVIAGMILIIGYVIYIRATLRSIGIFGILLVAALIGAIGWALYDFGILRFQGPGLITWLANISLSLILGVGMSWSMIRRRLTGQLDVDDVDNGE